MFALLVLRWTAVSGVCVTLCTLVGGAGAVCGLSGSRHRFVASSRPPLRTRVVPSNMRQCVALKMAVYPASQNFAVESRDACASPGTMWASMAVPRIHGMSTLHVCVDCSVLSSGNVMVIGCTAIRLLVTCTPSTRKRLVAPESLRAVALVLCCSVSCWALWWVCSLAMVLLSSSSSKSGAK